MKLVHKLRVTLHACKGNAPVSVKKKSTKKCEFVQAIKHGYRCVNVRLSTSTKFLVDSYLGMYVMKPFLDMLKKGAPRCMRV